MNFIQTSQVNSVSSRDVHMKCWLWFIDFSLSYGPSCDINLFCDKELFGGMITFSDSSSYFWYGSKNKLRGYVAF